MVLNDNEIINNFLTHLAIAFVILTVILTPIFYFFGKSLERDEQEELEKLEKWKRFKEQYECKLIEIDDTGFLGKKYKWQCNDGKIVINRFRK